MSSTIHDGATATTPRSRRLYAYSSTRAAARSTGPLGSIVPSASIARTRALPWRGMRSVRVSHASDDHNQEVSSLLLWLFDELEELRAQF